jgi:hypothetical protein
MGVESGNNEIVAIVNYMLQEATMDNVCFELDWGVRTDTIR